MFKFLRNPFAKRREKTQRMSAYKELGKNENIQPKPKVAEAKPEKRKNGLEKDARLKAGYGIFLNPHATEKTAHAGSFDTYVFIVSRWASKIEIKKAFWRMYNVKPVSIQIVNMPAKGMYFRQKAGVKSAWKKAYIRVPKGNVISVYEGV